MKLQRFQMKFVLTLTLITFIKTSIVVTCYLSSSDILTVGAKKIKNLEVARFTFVSVFSLFDSIISITKKKYVKKILLVIT